MFTPGKTGSALLFVAAAMTARGDVIDELFKLPAPPRDWQKAIGYVEPPDDGPAADAPIGMLVAYWSTENTRWKTPPPAVQERLVDGIEQYPEALSKVVEKLPTRPEVCARVRRAAQSLPKMPVTVDWWLRHHDPAARASLIKSAREAYDMDIGGDIWGSEDLEALAASDWTTAENVLRTLASGPQRRTALVAETLLFAHATGAERDGLREHLRTIVADRAALAGMRKTALEALLRDDWPGRDSWLLTLFSDPAFGQANDGALTCQLSSEVVASDPERWIPIMVSLLGTGDRVVRAAAVHALAQFHGDRGRADALRPILCWLSDPSWVPEPFDHKCRLEMVKTVAQLNLREAIPHLVWIIEHEADTELLESAAEALLNLNDASGNAAIRRALARTEDGTAVMFLVRVLLATGGCTPDELADDVLTAARGDQGSDPWNTRGTVAEKIGQIARFWGTGDDAVARALIARFEKSSDPLTLTIILEMDTPATSRFRLAQMRDDDERFLREAIQHARSIREHASAKLQQIALEHGVAGAIATVLSGNSKAIAALLAHGTDGERRAVLAAARALGESLDLSTVASLYGQNAKLDRAIDAWLLANDERAARTTYSALHPGERHIFGTRSTWQGVDSDRFAGFDRWEEEWRKRVAAGEADEVIGLASLDDEANPIVEIVVANGKAKVRAAGREVAANTAALAQLHASIDGHDFDRLPPFIQLFYFPSGDKLEYVHVTRNAGARVFMDAPHGAYGTPYYDVVRRLEALAAHSDSSGTSISSKRSQP